MNFRAKAVLFLASGGPVGKIPVAPGTFGSLLGLPVGYLLSRLSLPGGIAVAVLLVIAAIWTAGEAEAILGRKDPGAIVIDEIAGMAVTLIGLPFTLPTAAAGFFLFRALDIFKPFPIGLLERRLEGGTAVVLDDVAAGIAGNLLLRVLLGFGFF